MTTEDYISEFLKYGNGLVLEFEPKADRSLGQFSRMAQYMTEYGNKWADVLMHLRGKKTVIMDRVEVVNPKIFNDLDAALDEAMHTIKAAFHKAYAPK